MLPLVDVLRIFEPAPADPSTSDNPTDTTTPPVSTDEQPTPPGDQEPGQMNTPPADEPDPVLATSATVSDWGASVPAPNMSDGSTIQYRYCTYSYSDGSTQQRQYTSKTTFSGGVVALDDPSFDCTTATAP